MCTPHVDDQRAPQLADAADERGAVLVLALVMLLVGVLIIGGVSYETSNNLSNSLRFEQARSLQYAARSTTNLAIQNIRYTPLLSTTENASPPAPCWATSPPGSPSELTSVSPSMEAWCSTQFNATSASTRTVTISTCPVSGAVTAAQCAAAPYLQAIVTFDDYAPGIVAPNPKACTTTCGSSMVTASWLWSPTIPTVTSISPSAGSSAGGTRITVTGTGFVTGSSVNFVEGSVSGSTFTPAPDNTILTVPASGVTVNGATSLSVATPAEIEGTTYAVTVTTPTGTAAATTNAVFSYTQVAPVISAVSPTSPLSSTGGTLLTLSGAGFTSNARVTFTQESGGSVVAGGAVYSVVGSPFVSVASPGSLTVVSPGVTVVASYFVTVTTPAGTSPMSTSATVTYTYVVPTVSAISPTSGPDAGGTAVSITGTGFLTGTLVYFIPQAQGCTGGFGSHPLAANNVAISSQSTITATTPTVGSAAPYYVYVTTSSGGSTDSSNCYPIYTYAG